MYLLAVSTAGYSLVAAAPMRRRSCKESQVYKVGGCCVIFAKKAIEIYYTSRPCITNSSSTMRYTPLVPKHHANITNTTKL
jgi:hypothetical protein